MTYYHINNNGYHVERYSSLIKELYNESLVVLEDFPDNENVKVLLNVQHYYQRQVSNHNGKISSSHPNYYTNFESIINRLGIYSDENPTPEDLVKLHSDLLSLVEKTQTRLLKDLRFVLKFLEPLYLNYDFEIDVPEFLKLLDQYKTLNKSLKDTNSFIADRLAKSNRPNLLFWLEKFNEKFFHLSNPLPCFFISNRTNLRQLIFKTITELSELKRKTELTIDIPNDIELAINPYLLRLIFFEIIENKFKHAPASNASINYQENYKDIRIIYRQHGEFEFRKYENGLTMIRNIVRHCSGKTESRSKPEYEFEIIFPKMIKYANI